MASAVKSANNQAVKISQDRKKMKNLLMNAVKKASSSKAALENTWHHLTALIRMVRYNMSGQYSNLPWKTLIIALTGIIYFVNPLDAIPDILPVVGLVDDAALIAFIAKSIGSEVAEFLKWEKKHLSAVGAN